MKVTVEITEKEIKLFKEILEKYIELSYIKLIMWGKLIIWSSFQ